MQSRKLLLYPYNFSEDDISKAIYHLKDTWGIDRSGWEWEVLFLLIMCIRRISTDTKDSIQLL